MVIQQHGVDGFDTVGQLVRVAIGAIRIGALPIGKTRELTADEVRRLRS